MKRIFTFCMAFSVLFACSVEGPDSVTDGDDNKPAAEETQVRKAGEPAAL